MPLLPAAALSLLLSLLGVASYMGTGRKSVTALIPTFFGIVSGALTLGRAVSDSFDTALAMATLILAIAGAGATAGALVHALRDMMSARKVGAATLSKAMMATTCVACIGWGLIH